MSLPPIARLLADPRLAVTDTSIVCLICCGVFRQLTNTHLRAHGTTATAYKQRFGYNTGRPLMCGMTIPTRCRTLPSREKEDTASFSYGV